MSDDGDEMVLIVDDEEQLAESYALHLDDDYETDIATAAGKHCRSSALISMLSCSTGECRGCPATM